jgi:hypothetical protein
MSIGKLRVAKLKFAGGQRGKFRLAKVGNGRENRMRRWKGQPCRS